MLESPPTDFVSTGLGLLLPTRSTTDWNDRIRPPVRRVSRFSDPDFHRVVLRQRQPVRVGRTLECSVPFLFSKSIKIHVISRIPEERNPQFYILEVGNLAGKKFISVRSFCRFSIRLSDFINYSICGNCLKTSSLSVHINFNYFARTRHLFKSARLIVQVHRPTQNVLNLFLSL